VWSPASRIGMKDSLTPAFRQHWQAITRQSWRTYQGLLGLPGSPVEFVDQYGLSDTPPGEGRREPRKDGKPEFAELERELVPEIGIKSVEVKTAATPFAVPYVRKSAQLMFNLPAYARMLLADFRAAGGRIVIDEFHTPADFARLPHKTLVNCPGYAARALMGDNSIVSVRGQLAHMIPEPDAHYGLYYKRVGLTPRRDGFVLQVTGGDDYFGYDNANREPDLAEAELAVNTIASAFKPAA
jgi:hypothetical protein